jgi:hypothetical protein
MEMNALSLDDTLSWHILTSCQQGGQDNIKMELKKRYAGNG